MFCGGIVGLGMAVEWIARQEAEKHRIRDADDHDWKGSPSQIALAGADDPDRDWDQKENDGRLHEIGAAENRAGREEQDNSRPFPSGFRENQAKTRPG